MSQSTAAQTTATPQAQLVSHEMIHDLENQAQEAYNLTLSVRNIRSMHELANFGDPLRVLHGITEFALRSSDIAGRIMCESRWPLLHLRLTPR